MEKSLEVIVKMLDMHGLRYRIEGKKNFVWRNCFKYDQTCYTARFLSKMPYYSEYECLCPPGE